MAIGTQGIQALDGIDQDKGSMVGLTNPISSKLGTDHSHQFINRYKTCELALSSIGGGIKFSDSAGKGWGFWRESMGVDESVYLFADSTSIGFSYSHEYGNQWEKLNGTILNKIQGAMELARTVALTVKPEEQGQLNQGGAAVSKYIKTPVWNGASPVSMDSIKFKFQFGQAGLFSGQKEVVIPIIQLASVFLPIGSGNYWNGPVPTGPTYLVEFAKKIAAGGKGVVDSLGKAVTDLVGGDGIGVIKDLSDVESKILNMQNDAIESALKKSNGLAIRFGRLVCGPFLVKTVNWDFDFNNIDDQGFPTSGSVSFGGLENIIMAGASGRPADMWK